MSEGRSDFFAELAQNISYEASDQGENVQHYNTNDSDHCSYCSYCSYCSMNLLHGNFRLKY